MDDGRSMREVGRAGVSLGQEAVDRAARKDSRPFDSYEEAVYVLHVFQKRSQKTAQPDLDLGKSRYADLLKWRREEGQ